MAGTTLTTAIRGRLSTFAAGLARPFNDSRRRGFVTDMVTGLVAGGHVHLTAVARATHRGDANIHAAEKRLSRHLGSAHWDAAPLAAELLRRSAALVTDDTLIVADTTDLAKYHARKLEGLGRVHDGSDPDGRTAPGYCIFEAFVRVGGWQLFPLVVEPLKVYAGAPTGENAEILAHQLRVHEATGRKGTWVLDRGFDRRELFGPLVKSRVAFVVRQRGDRTARTADGRDVSVSAVVAEQACPTPRRWPRGGMSVAVEVWLPEVGPDPFLVVIGWRVPNSERPLVLLVSPAARAERRVVRPGVPQAVGGGGRQSRDQAAVRGGGVPGPVVDVDPPAAVAGGVGVLVAESVGGSIVRPTPGRPDEPPVAVAEAGHLPVQLDRLPAPRTPSPPPEVIHRHWVNSRSMIVDRGWSVCDIDHTFVLSGVDQPSTHCALSACAVMPSYATSRRVCRASSITSMCRSSRPFGRRSRSPTVRTSAWATSTCGGGDWSPR